MPPFESESCLVIQFLGAFRVRNASSVTPLSLTPKLRDLLVILASTPGKQHSREGLIECLWRDADEDHGRRCLRSALWRLRSVLEPEGVEAGRYLKATDAGGICFQENSDAIIDSVVFDRLLTPVVPACRSNPDGTLSPTEYEALRQAVDLYDGEFVPGCYDDWVLIERERYRERFIASNIKLAHHYTTQRYHEHALECCWSVLNEDPLRETVHRQMLQVYGLCGRRTEAVALYRWLSQRLKDELDVDPMPETTALYRSVIGQESVGGRPANSIEPVAAALEVVRSQTPVEASDLRGALHLVEDIIRTAESVRSSLKTQLSQTS